MTDRHIVPAPVIRIYSQEDLTDLRGGRVVLVRPSQVGTTRALSFPSALR
jgi:hypothetical protein